MMEFKHIPVLLNEVIEGLEIKPDGVYIDCTLGGAGHSVEIAKRLGKGTLIGFDQDEEAVQAAKNRLKDYNCIIINDNFSNIKTRLENEGIKKADGVLMDLGVSSHQLDTAERGFSYHEDAPLDMRMSKKGISAFEVVNDYSEQEIARILFLYGEEKYSRSIARAICNKREISPIKTTLELASIIRENVPVSYRKAKNPAKKSFQAIRIEVNKELEVLQIGLNDAFDVLNIGGRLAVITFHSLEDRIVKNKFNELCKGCTCPSDFPICVCGNTPKAKKISKKPIVAGEEELKINNRSRSAKLRIIEKIAE